MSEELKICPTCERPLAKTPSLSRHLIIGAIVGFVIGTSFVAFWFGTSAGFLHNMALIHEVSGTVLGLLGGLIVRSLRK
ncbi:MAG: hypothetical protein KAS88_01955 [Deltaproteobacteria bacterium]|nr:hypothetical protein [Deltaproteobacteria bacterium]